MLRLRIHGRGDYRLIRELLEKKLHRLANECAVSQSDTPLAVMPVLVLKPRSRAPESFGRWASVVVDGALSVMAGWRLACLILTSPAAAC